MNEQEIYRKIVNYTLMIVIGILTFWVVKPFIFTIINACVLAYLFYPVNRKLRKVLKKKRLAAFTTVLVILLLIIVPLIFIINNLTADVSDVIQKVAIYYTENDFAVEEHLQTASDKLGIEITIKDIISRVSSWSLTLSETLLKSVPQKVLNFAILIFLLFYLFKDGDSFQKAITEKVPVSDAKKQYFVTNIRHITHAIIYGVILTAIFQGVIGGIGYWIFGFKDPIFWGLMTAIFAVVPLVGTGIVWIPASIYLAVLGFINQQPMLIGKGIGLAIYGALIIATVDNFIRPYLISGRAKIHPVFILLGILGGIAFFGFIGVVLGPLIISMFLVTIDIHRA